MIKVYGKPNCKWCTKVKAYLEENNIEFEYTNLKDKKNRQARKLMSDLKVEVVPIVIYDDNIYQPRSSGTRFYKDLQEWLDKYVKR